MQTNTGVTDGRGADGDDTLAHMPASSKATASPTLSSRDRLLWAAEAIILESGVAAITARALTRRAGVNLGMVSYHFKGLDDLLIELFDENFERFAQLQFALLEDLARAKRVTVERIMDAVVRSLWQPPVYLDEGRGSQIIDELFAHGSPAVREAATRRMVAGLTGLLDGLAPLVPHLSRETLLLRLTCIAGAVRSAVPRSRTWELYQSLASKAASDEERVIEGIVAFAAAALRTN